jgi:Tol biopolymer transport system component
MLLRLKDGRQIHLLSRPDKILGLAWSSDEHRIVFSSQSNYGALWETSLARPDDLEILPIGHDASDLAAEPSGQGLAYVQGSRNVNIWRLDLLASPPQARKLGASSREQSSPGISPDGSKIAFESTQSGAREIWVADADGSNAQQVTDFRNPVTGTPRWSPDGKLIAFDSRVGGEANLYVVDPAGGVPHKLSIDRRGNCMPSWSKDGAWIYFTDRRGSGLWKVPTNGGHALQIAESPASFAMESPNGGYVYFARGKKLWRAKTDGSTEEPVTGMPEVNPIGDEWFPAEAGIYFLAHANGETTINLFDLQSRQTRPIFTLQKTTPDWIGGMPVSKDGKFMLYPQVDSASSDLMMIGNWR